MQKVLEHFYFGSNKLNFASKIETKKSEIWQLPTRHFTLLGTLTTYKELDHNNNTTITTLPNNELEKIVCVTLFYTLECTSLA